jgi:polyhydroxybutyrate depolymerase
MSVRVRVGLCLILVFALHCGGSGTGESSGDAGPRSSGAGACGTRTGMRGKTSRTLTVDGTKRTYIAYLPESPSATTSVPFVFVFHGAGMDGAEMYDVTEYSTIADSDGVAVAFLDGQDTSSATGATTLDPWNVSDDGAAVCGDGNLVNNSKAGVDFDFMDAVKADIAQDQCLDSAHVFASGFSMGGYFTHHIGCDRTDVRAVAPHSGGTLASLSSCKTGHVPIIIFHGTADFLISPSCDDPHPPASGAATETGFTASATLWAQKNGCGATYSTVVENGTGGGDGQCYVYDGCPADGQVELCTFTGMSHCYAGGASTGSSTVYSCPTYASATQLQWNFFKKYAW